MITRICFLWNYVFWARNTYMQKQPLEVFYKKRCSRKFRKIHRKKPVPESVFWLKLQRPATLLKKSLWHRCFPVTLAKWHRCFPVTLAKFLRTSFLQNTSGRLLLYNSIRFNRWFVTLEEYNLLQIRWELFNYLFSGGGWASFFHILNSNIFQSTVSENSLY